jgi:hypothetical protein
VFAVMMGGTEEASSQAFHSRVATYLDVRSNSDSTKRPHRAKCLPRPGLDVIVGERALRLCRGAHRLLKAAAAWTPIEQICLEMLNKPPLSQAVLLFPAVQGGTLSR